MLLDVRLPLGLLFLGIGLLVALQGLISGPSPAAAGLNIDLIWGVAMAVFGALVLILARLSRRRGG